MEKHHEYNDQQLIYTKKLRVRMKRSQKIRDQMVKSVRVQDNFSKYGIAPICIT